MLQFTSLTAGEGTIIQKYHSSNDEPAHCDRRALTEHLTAKCILSLSIADAQLV